jgi:hypothetical protein
MAGPVSSEARAAMSSGTACRSAYSISAMTAAPESTANGAVPAFGFEWQFALSEGVATGSAGDSVDGAAGGGSGCGPMSAAGDASEGVAAAEVRAA